MSTHGVIARKTGEGRFRGVYHHYDSYPEGLGQELLDLYHGYFQQNIERMAKELVDDHPAGFSTIAGMDAGAPRGMMAAAGGKDGPGIGWQCYCHGDRNDAPWPINQDDLPGYVQYIYVLDCHRHTMQILVPTYDERGTWLTMEIDMMGTIEIPGNWQQMLRREEG